MNGLTRKSLVNEPLKEFDRANISMRTINKILNYDASWGANKKFNFDLSISGLIYHTTASYTVGYANFKDNGNFHLLYFAVRTSNQS